MTDQDKGAWQSPRLRDEIERNERRLSFENLMAEVDAGAIDLPTAIAILSLTDKVLDVDDGQDALFELEGGDA